MKFYNDPIFVIGTGRCGLSPLMDLIAYHPKFSWPSQYLNKFPKKYYLASLSRLVELPILRGSFKYAKLSPKHAEPFNLWNNIYYGFSRPYRDLVSDDVTNQIRSEFQNSVKQIMKYQHKKHFITEYSGWSRIKFMKEIFPKCKFIHIIRDGRAVANSLINTSYWKGWEGIYNWRWGIPDNYSLKLLEKYNHSFVAIAAIQWKLLIKNIIGNTLLLPKNDLLIIKYEDMVSNPINIANTCIEFSGLKYNNRTFYKHLKTVKIIDANKNNFRIRSWENNFNNDQIEMMNDILKDELINLNYL